ncbi:hypothetical protein D3C85_1470800 [compost metagenome]
MSEFDGGAAFPIVHPDGQGVQYYGMSLRDYFAAKAIVGFCENSAGDYEWLAKQAYQMADAMLKERAK